MKSHSKETYVTADGLLARAAVILTLSDILDYVYNCKALRKKRTLYTLLSIL